MTPTQRSHAYTTIEALSYDLDTHKERSRQISASFDLDGVDYQIEGTVYNHYESRLSNAGDIETGLEDVLIDFTFKGTIVGFHKSDDECVLEETEIEF